MTKKGQINPQQIFAAIFGIIVLLALVPVFKDLFNQNCPTCDCSPYQNQLDSCKQDLVDQEVKIVYINNTIEVPVIEEKIIYKDFPLSMTFISISLIISLSLTLLSFKIKLPRRMEERFEELEKLITLIKFGSLILTTLIFIKLIMILLPLL